eukprot:TRINITY_DN3156_c0_g1_i2.p1 TRINITY_DN3156_c0_g1~~TRINITY_DN3156_c0_g1_i2.p1  ORF type:complete len:312 (-),score=126.88 TRINITY_DN3156_c0_g1_i2:34-969(-)
MSDKLEAFLIAHTAAELAAGKPAVVDAAHTDTVEAVLKKLNKHNIISLPVRGPDGTYQGFVSMIDIMTYIAFSSYDPSNPGSTDNFVRDTTLRAPVSNLLGLSPESERLWSFSPEDTLVKVLDHFSKGVHRALVASDAAGAQAVVTQTDAVRFIAAHLAEVPETAAVTLDSAGLVSGAAAVVSIQMTETALDGFRKMTMHGVSSVCVIGEDGASMLGTLSASDLRGITAATVKSVLQPVLSFLRQKNTAQVDVRAPTAAISKSATIAQALATVLATKAHRVWVCEGSKPVGVVSLTDLCTKFSKYDFKHKA